LEQFLQRLRQGYILTFLATSRTCGIHPGFQLAGAMGIITQASVSDQPSIIVPPQKLALLVYWMAV
jgi:hypothetical protein